MIRQLILQPLLHVFIRSIVCMFLFWFCLGILQKWSFFFFDFGFSWPSFVFFPLFCVTHFSLVQFWSLNYGKPRRPFRLCVPTWHRLQVAYFQLLHASVLDMTGSSFLLQAVYNVCHEIPSHNFILFFLLFRMWDSFSREKKLQIKSWNSG